MAPNVHQYAGTQSAWHNLGTVRPFTTAIEAVRESDMDWNIHKLPATYTMPDGTVIRDEEAFTLWREPTVMDAEWKRLSRNLVSADYMYMQNVDVANSVDYLTESTKTDTNPNGWRFATCAALGNGETFFVCLDMGESTIAGEQFHNYFTFGENRNGARSAIGYVSPIRAVCSNTYNLGIKQASSKMEIAHRATMRIETDEMMQIISEAQRTGMSVNAALNALAEIKIDEVQFSDMLDAVVPMPTMPRILTMNNLTGVMAEKRKSAEYIYEQKVKGIARTRDSIIAEWNRSNDEMMPVLRGTAYAAFNAVTEYTTHKHGTGGSRGRTMSVASRAEWDLMGDGQKMRDAAYVALTSGELFS